MKKYAFTALLLLAPAGAKQCTYDVTNTGPCTYGGAEEKPGPNDAKGSTHLFQADEVNQKYCERKCTYTEGCAGFQDVGELKGQAEPTPTEAGATCAIKKECTDLEVNPGYKACMTDADCGESYEGCCVRVQSVSGQPTKEANGETEAFWAEAVGAVDGRPVAGAFFMECFAKEVLEFVDENYDDEAKDGDEDEAKDGDQDGAKDDDMDGAKDGDDDGPGGPGGPGGHGAKLHEPVEMTGYDFFRVIQNVYPDTNFAPAGEDPVTFPYDADGMIGQLKSTKEAQEGHKLLIGCADAWPTSAVQVAASGLAVISSAMALL